MSISVAMSISTSVLTPIVTLKLAQVSTNRQNPNLVRCSGNIAHYVSQGHIAKFSTGHVKKMGVATVIADETPSRRIEAAAMSSSRE
mmetsp:Transcript_23035/g.31524  ORF Transcript_23035/g.31524 Transcript_23035/m.31524 type:complete len:87 (+) Transcript_23035:740-1000(+)